MSRVAHFEIHASDPARTIEFYSSLFDCDSSRGVPPVHTG